MDWVEIDGEDDVEFQAPPPPACGFHTIEFVAPDPGLLDYEPRIPPLAQPVTAVAAAGQDERTGRLTDTYNELSRAGPTATKDPVCAASIVWSQKLPLCYRPGRLFLVKQFTAKIFVSGVAFSLHFTTVGEEKLDGCHEQRCTRFSGDAGDGRVP